MRYRPYGDQALSLSAVGMALGEDLARKHGPEAVYTALESGVNVFQVTAGDTAALAALGEALKHVDRRLAFVILRVGVRRGGDVRDFSPPGLVNAVRMSGSAMRAGPFDLVLLDDPGAEELSPRALMAMRGEIDGGRVRQVGVSGENEALDAYISAHAFDVLSVPYNVQSGWRERLRLKAAAQNGMPVLGYRFFPPEFDQQEKAEAVVASQATRLNLFRKPAPRIVSDDAASAYEFLTHVKGWSAQELCLAYSMTEPGIASMMVAPRTLEELESLAAVPDRDFPTFVAAQIEMARFASVPVARSA